MEIGIAAFHKMEIPVKFGRAAQYNFAYEKIVLFLISFYLLNRKHFREVVKWDIFI